MPSSALVMYHYVWRHNCRINRYSLGDHRMGEEFQSDQDFALGAGDFPSERDYKLHCLRHSTSHIMAAAVQEVFPDVQLGIGPPIQNGSSYDPMLPPPPPPHDLP